MTTTTLTVPATATTVLASEVAELTAIGLYLVYAAVAIALVVYLARTLRANGVVFLHNVFDDENLANSVNHLLVVGFYLLNLGYAFLLYQLQPSYASVTEAFNQLIVKLGWLLLSLGVIHLFNMLVFWRIRNHRASRLHPPAAPLAHFAPPAPLTSNAFTGPAPGNTGLGNTGLGTTATPMPHPPG